MQKLTTEQVKKIARLCRIKLTPEEVEKFTTQLTSILEYVHKLNEIDTKNITFKSHVDLLNVIREDVAGECLGSSAAVGQAQYKKGKYFSVPKVLTTES